MFSEIGKKTSLFTRFSTVGGERGSADSARDPRGFATKFYTEEGNLDWVFNDTPIFFIRDPVLFPLLIHTQKRNPQTNLRDPTLFWDYLSTHQESVHQVMHTFSNRGTPSSYRHMNGYTGHTYKFVNKDGEFFYVQVHFKTNQGIKNFTGPEAIEMQSKNPDWNTQDLFQAIERGDYPSWTMYVQVLTPEQAEKFRWNIFDLTKVWPHKEVPLRPVGTLTLNRNPQNYFAEVEQFAVCPSHLVPGIEASADPVLQSRLFSYSDTHRYRLGVNYQSIPVNRPKHAHAPYQRDGFAAVDGNYGSEPHYPSTFYPVPLKKPAVKRDAKHEFWSGEACSVKSEVVDEDFVQPRALWKVLGSQEGEQEGLVWNVSTHLCGAHPRVREQTYEMFTRVDERLGDWIKNDTEARAAGKM